MIQWYCSNIFPVTLRFLEEQFDPKTFCKYQALSAHFNKIPLDKKN